MLILGLNKTTLLDYPGRVAATIFTGGCNFRCPFCHNGGLVLEPALQPSKSEEEILEFLGRRKNILKGVCITGGEPTLQADLDLFLGKIKELGYSVKLDTNGYAPLVLEKLLEEGLVDYVAMDIKNCPEKYAYTAGFTGEREAGFALEKVEKSVDLLKRSGISYEFRTTVVREFHRKEDFKRIGEWISGCSSYFLQQFRENENMIGQGYHAYDREEMEALQRETEQVPGMKGKVFLRGVEA